MDAAGQTGINIGLDWDERELGYVLNVSSILWVIIVNDVRNVARNTTN